MKKYAILSVESLNEDEKFAVEETLHFLKEITKKEVEVVNVLPQDTETYCISLGKTAAFEAYCAKTGYVLAEHKSDDAFDVCVDGNVCYIVGKKATGTLFGLYETLKRMFGFQLYTENDFSYETKEIKDGFTSFVFDPSIPIRTIGVYPVYDQNQNYIRRMKLWRYNENWVMWGHTTFHVLPFAKYSVSNPEWFAQGNNAFENMEKAEQVLDSSVAEEARKGMALARSLCLTNKEMRKEFVKNLKAFIEADPKSDLVMLGQEDNQCVCQCKNCKELRAKFNGIESGIVLSFTNDVVKEINEWAKENYPERKLRFVTFAYMYTIFPPVKKTENGYEPINKELQLEDNLYILYAPNGANATTSYFSDDNTVCFDECFSGPNHTKTKEIWEGWCAITNNLMMWSYNADYVDFLAPFLMWDSVEMNFKKYAEYGVEYIFEEGAYPYPITNFSELKIFTAAELMWDCNRPLRGLIEDFISHYYDDKTGCVLKYFDYLNGCKEYIDKTFNRKMIPGLYADYEVLSSGLYWPKKTLEEALAIMDDGAAIPEDYDNLTEYEWRKIAERTSCEYILLKNYLQELSYEAAAKKIDFIERITKKFNMNKIGEFAPKQMDQYLQEWKETNAKRA